MTDDEPELIACHECDALYRREPLRPGEQARCRRCGALLYRRVRNARDRALALFLASLVLLLLAHAFPFLALKVAGLSQQDHVIGSGLSLVAFGMPELGTVVFLTSTLFPFLTIVGTLYLLVGQRAGIVLPGVRPVFRVVHALGPWSLLGVFMLGTLIAVVKLRDIATVVPGPGLFAFGALVLVYAAARANLVLDEVWAPLRIRGLRRSDVTPDEPLTACHVCRLLHRQHDAHGNPQQRCVRCRAPLHHRIVDSVQRTWALLLAASIMLLPANLLPVMTVSQLGRGEPNTILSGVVHLIEAGMWGLALIVFFASIVVPLAKIATLAFLLRTIGRRSSWRPRDRTRLYRATELIGAWSMVDVFLVGLLAGLVSLGVLASIEPGLGATFFGAAVVLTMLAAHSFDPRLIWDFAVAPDEGPASS